MRINNVCRDYLLVPMMPTPNGPLHLGHIAGPYLKVDVLARYLRILGNKAYLVACSDPFENHVVKSAESKHISSEELCNLYHDQIATDFLSLHINFDKFINPISQVWASLYRQHHSQILQDLICTHKTIEHSEQYLVDKEMNKKLIGAWVNGQCPGCHSNMNGFFCENCGLQSNPSELLNPRSLGDTKNLFWESNNSIFLQFKNIKALTKAIEKMNLADKFNQAMLQFIKNHDGKFRLTTPDDWSVGPFQVSDTQFNLYNTYYGYATFCGWIYSQLTHLSVNAFDKTSSTYTITSCGLDNATDLISDWACANAHHQYKPFDMFLGNFFFKLGNTKFSTSRNHAIFVSDILKNTKIDVNALRFYLALINPEHHSTHFYTSEFVDFYNNYFICQLLETLQIAFESISGMRINHVDENIIKEFTHIISGQKNNLLKESFSLSKICLLVKDWLSRFQYFHIDLAQIYWWLKSFAVLSYPIMPELAENIWRNLGYTTAITLNDFFEITRPNSIINIKSYTFITNSDIPFPNNEVIIKEK